MSKVRRYTIAAVPMVLLAVSSASGQTFVNPDQPKPECTIQFPDLAIPDVGKDRLWPGYLAEWKIGKICVAFTPTSRLKPAAYVGDYYVDEFTDERIRQRWHECRKDPACAERVMADAKRFIKAEEPDTGTVDTFGKIDRESAVDLAQIRRPAYFGKAPFSEQIAQADPSSYVVEFTAPRDGYERTHLGLNDSIKLRGWYIRGAGVGDGTGKKIRALIIVNNGGGNETTALGHPWYRADAATGDYVFISDPPKSEQSSMVGWRQHIHAFYAAGFDVLITDRRGNGISGGREGYDLGEQATDTFRMLEQLQSGQGLRIGSADGRTLEGRAAVDLLLDGASIKDLPAVVLGYSRGSYATQWFMHKNFVEDCDVRGKKPTCKPAVGLANIKGAILYGFNAGSLGYRAAGHDLREAALREEFNITQYTDSSALANINKWPALQLIKGSYDYVEALEGSWDAYQRFHGLKDFSVFAGQHILPHHHPGMLEYKSRRMVAFATAAVLGRDRVEGSTQPKNIRELVRSVPQFWEMDINREGWKPL
ncbi:hypothetical protein PMI07_005589 [Rhizobium sp. CF080]|uniref:hypothetical protein n=1 Tax=Rhizobium sp. (strain CF080) TaxID=1144310 RepID=UPI00027192E4|nr:hypothetical protein [Rhizobium sp. CF080]EUB99308.1 hypothetical protein PMI07_005589 [Rhizobium sp. CF080]